MAEAQKILETGKIRIIVDHRETGNHVFAHLKGFDVALAEEQLKAGDYICSDRVCVERKTVSDFVNSLLDQRIFKQVANMLACFEKPLLIIEGAPELLFSGRNVHPNAIRGVLASLAIDQRIPIIWTKDAKETASQLYWIAYREQIGIKRSVAIRCPRKMKNITQQQEFLIAGLPDINTKLSKNLLKKLKTPKRIFSANTEKLMKVEGIGQIKAKKIWNLLNKEYEEK
jgi:Fanconi anemia group M protein